MTTDRPIPTIGGMRARRAMETADLPADLPDMSRPPARPAPPARYQRDLPPISLADAEAEPPSEALFPAPAPQRAPERKPNVTLSTTIAHRGRQITITTTDMTADQFCDLLDKRGFAPPEPLPATAPMATADDLPDGWKLCRKHGAPMRSRNKQGDTWNSHNVGTAENPIWCKGYRGADSPGYEVE